MSFRIIFIPSLNFQPTLCHTGNITLSTCGAAAGYSLILEALRTAQTSYVVAVRQSSVLFAVALGILWLGERPGRVRIIGACVIAVGVSLLGFAQ